MKTELVRQKLAADDLRFALVVSRWNDKYTSRLESGALAALKGAGAYDDSIEKFYVPGAFDLPLACMAAAETLDFDAIIALGVVIRGDTPHFDFVAGQAAAGIMQASIKTGIPMLFGVITADNVDQVEERCGEKDNNKGYEAARSAIEMAHLMRVFDDKIEASLGDFPDDEW